ncbi:aconitase-domain-containing protein [Aspergillus ellipticus CBS 707.79]|uniref:Aconitate hydratase, mitochondrial n=1 Tax=Aspergillus ellipticus CBS 707.79 TaxID=1448320 RepID=A0A319F1I1_9EURO|nr:aconitase-domain-containing protein [Aspergillus ellipticus CBS 707.79]
MARGLTSYATAPISRQETQTINLHNFTSKVGTLRDRLKRPLTYSEKVLYSHLDDSFDEPIVRGQTQLKLRPLRIACQDATAQIMLIQFMSAGMDAAAVPTTVHCDHLIVSRDGEIEDLPRALDAHREVYEFMESACQKYNMGFWRPGAGIIHQIVLENYAIPGSMMIGTDSHTPNARGLGMTAIGAPKVLGVKLTGQLSSWAAPKDIISTVAGMISVKGGTGSIIEYFGPGAQTLFATGMATVCNMGAETGATTSIFPYNPQMLDYLRATHRKELARAVESISHELQADRGAEYDRVIEIDLSKLEPCINGPFTPDLSTPVSKFGDAVKGNEWPELAAGLIGSCTNSSFEDMGRAANLAQQALDAGLKPQMPLLISPGSLETRDTLEKAGVLPIFEKLGATMLPNACGLCCGSWDRADMPKGTPNSIITSYNRNFSGRLDSNPLTHVFLTSPEIVMAKVFTTDLTFNPLTDILPTPSGTPFHFHPPTSNTLPSAGYTNSTTKSAYLPPPTSDRTSLTVKISPTSTRLQRLTPSPPWSGTDFHSCLILIKTKGKCTTDHITPAGPWFRYRGHLENISNNTLIGAVNAETGKVNAVRNQLTGKDGQSVPDTARYYKKEKVPWVVVADWNYGEGSSREHAALQPRYLGGGGGGRLWRGRLPGFMGRIMKKQGMLALTFRDPRDYERVGGGDRVSIVGLQGLEPGREVRMLVSPEDGGEEWEVLLNHTFSWEEIRYFRAGSALTLMGGGQGQ